MRFGKRTDRHVAVDGTATCNKCGETVPIDISGHCELGHRVTSPETAAQALGAPVAAEGTAEAVAAAEPAAVASPDAEQAAEPAAADPPPWVPVGAEAVAFEADDAESAAPATDTQADLDYEGLLRNGSQPS